jgi:hypothetical protein
MLYFFGTGIGRINLCGPFPHVLEIASSDVRGDGKAKAQGESKANQGHHNVQSSSISFPRTRSYQEQGEY